MKHVPLPASHVAERSYSSEARSEWDLRTILSVLRPHRVAIIVGAAIGFAGGLTYALLTPKQFESSVQVAPATSTNNNKGLGSLLGQLGGLGTLAGIDLPTGSQQDPTAVAVLRSNAFVGDFLRSEGDLAIAEQDSRGILSRFLDRHPKEQQVINRFRTRLMRVEEDRRAGTTTLTIRSHDKEAAARMANGMIRRLNSTQRQRAIDESSRSIAYLEEQIDKASSVEVRQALYTVMEGELKSIAIAKSREDYTFRILDPAIPALDTETVAPNTPLRTTVGALLGAASALLLSMLLSRRHAR